MSKLVLVAMATLVARVQLLMATTQETVMGVKALATAAHPVDLALYRIGIVTVGGRATMMEISLFPEHLLKDLV